MSENQFSVGEKATHFIIDEVAKANTNFRQVLWTGKHSQLVAMTIPVGGEIGDEVHDTTDQLLWVQPEDVLLAFSIRRYASGPVKVAQRFRDAGAQVFSITDSSAAPLAALAHQRVLVRTSNASPFDSYTAAFFLCNALVSAVAQLRHAAVPETLQRRDGRWKDVEAQLIVDSHAPAGRRGKR